MTADTDSAIHPSGSSNGMPLCLRTKSLLADNHWEHGDTLKSKGVLQENFHNREHA